MMKEGIVSQKFIQNEFLLNKSRANMLKAKVQSIQLTNQIMHWNTFALSIANLGDKLCV